MSKLVQVNERIFDGEVLQSPLPVLADFWAAWCGPCRMIAPIVEELARDYDGRLKVAKIDVDANPDLARRFGIMSIPTLAIFKDGLLVSRIVGYATKAELQQHVEATLNEHEVGAAAGGK
ncbi:MAG: thioredoxin [Armatimonadetes bacterium 13_1_40CM_64_14]|nr:MAG: thioredoxin [Armatimonadetes bacterium 13_1_40CM_64_14]